MSKTRDISITMPTSLRSPLRLLSCVTLMLALLAAGCDRHVDQQLAEHEAAQTTLGITPKQFAARFNERLADVLKDMQVEEPEHMARLYMLDADRLHPGQYDYVLDAKVGPAQTTIIGTLNKSGELRNVGVMLTNKTQGARDEFLICASSAARSFITSGQDKLLPLITRLTTVALDNPGQRMTEVVADQLLSVELVPQGVLFQVQPRQ
ncbi:MULTISPECIES: attG domain containing protein [unclassified Herbaspirillum]|uniref:attG domain containing protein n=1 Tax=unclassified Herbaspirillum TaxID=2624150 RepID=UPI000981FE49|nr:MULTISPECIES: attG domain containing protein [unclassified Herbaspirillum]MCI1015333.1 attG domain containing protein [Herbaspirillum sp. C7C2]ONN65766.1 attG domain containing protein [Herbaspirillum sp. VT-16-41]